MARVLQVRDLLVHAVDDLKVGLLLALVQALQVSRLGLPLRQERFTLLFDGHGRCRCTWLALLRVALLNRSSFASSTKRRVLRPLVRVVADDDLPSR